MMRPRDRQRREYLNERLGLEDEPATEVVGDDNPDPTVEPVPQPDAEPEVAVESEPQPADEPAGDTTVVEVDADAEPDEDGGRVGGGTQFKANQDRETKQTAVCVRCGRTLSRRGHFPKFDGRQVSWYECANGCEPPKDADWPATCVSLADIENSVFDADLLDAADHLAPGEPEAAPLPAEDDGADDEDDAPDAGGEGGGDTPDDPPAASTRDDPPADEPTDPRPRRRGRAPPRRGLPDLRTRRGQRRDDRSGGRR